MSISQDLYTHAKQVIPGGVQLLSKRPEMYAPNQWPNYAVKAKGCEVWELDGNHYYDMTTNGIGACLLGYADPDVTKAMGNGHPIGAIIGTKAAMDGAQRSFISSTYWTESVGPAAALATIEKMEKTRVWEHAAAMGTMLKKDWQEAADRHGVDIHVAGLDCMPHFGFREKRIRTRMEHAAWLLRNTDDPVSRIAETVGYASETAFYQTFQTQFGQTPAQYRRGVRADM